MSFKIDTQQLFNYGLSILLQGDSGTGKSWLAKKLHENSPWKRLPFVVVNLATITESLMESELFGHCKGAFTGAVCNRVGLVETVFDGTLFLDEIGELSFDMQKKLLRLLEERVFNSVGSNVEKKFSGHLLFATNKNLKKMVEDGKFREDLYYRLMIAKKQMSHLSADKKDLEEKIKYFWNIYTSEYKKDNHCISVDMMDALKNYSWPGNIRELKNCMQYLAIVSTGTVELLDLPDWIDLKNGNHKSIDNDNFIIIDQLPINYEEAISIFEKKYFEYVLRAANGRINKTAKEIGISKVTLIAKSRRYGIDSMAMRFEHNRNMYNVA